MRGGCWGLLSCFLSGGPWDRPFRRRGGSQARMEVQLLLGAHKEQKRADHDRTDTGPYRDVDRFLVLDR